MPPAILGVAQCMNVRARAKLVNDPGLGFASLPGLDTRTHTMHSSVACTARELQPPVSAYTLAVARADTWCRRERELPSSPTGRGEARKGDGRKGDERGINVARKGFNESCLLLAQIATSTEKISISQRPGLSPSSSFSRLTLFHVVTAANGAAGLSALIRGEQFTVKRACD